MMKNARTSTQEVKGIPRAQWLEMDSPHYENVEAGTRLVDQSGTIYVVSCITKKGVPGAWGYALYDEVKDVSRTRSLNDIERDYKVQPSAVGVTDEQYARYLANTIHETDDACCDNMSLMANLQTKRFYCSGCFTRGIIGEAPTAPVSPVGRIEKEFNCKVTGVVVASRNGGKTYNATLAAIQNTGISSEIVTTLDEDTLRSLGWNPPQPQPRSRVRVRPSSFWTNSVKAKIASAQRSIPEGTPKAVVEAATQTDIGYSRKKFYGSLGKIKGRLLKHGVEPDMLKEYFYRKHNVRSMSGLNDKDLELAASWVQAMTTMEEDVFKKRTSEIKSVLSRTKCADCGDGIPLGKKRCSVCVGKMLGTWDGNTVNLPTTNAPVQVPSTVIEKDESKPDYSEIFVKPNAGNKKCHLATDPEGTGFADEILCDGEGSPLNDFRTQDDAVRYARKHYPGAKVIVLSCI